MANWLQTLGKRVVDAGVAKYKDERRRRAEDPLTREEKGQLLRFGKIRNLVPPDKVKALPPYEEETARNRIQLREFLAHPLFMPTLLDAERAQAAAFREKLAAVDRFYDNELSVVQMSLSVFADMPSSEYKQLRLEYHDKVTGNKSYGNNATGVDVFFDTASILTTGNGLKTGFLGSELKRTLRDFPKGEQAIMRLAEILQVMGVLSQHDVIGIRLPMLWNHGKSQMTVPPAVSKPKQRAAFNETVQMLIETKYGTPESAAETVQETCRKMLERDSTSPEVKAILNRYLYSGTRWLNSNDITPLLPKGENDKMLRLGLFDDGKELLYDRAESLATIAPPGSGKSTGHVMRNLLYLNAPAVVLDVKGEMYQATASWRNGNVGEVYRFAPNRPQDSLHFNPIDFITTDPDEAYEQAEKLAELLTVPPDKDEYFDTRSIQVIQAMVLYVALTKTGEARCMETVLDLLASGEPEDELVDGDDPNSAFDALIARLAMSEIRSLRRMGNALRKMPEKQLEGVFDSARTKLKVWESPAIARLTRDTNFRPEQLREERATLYLCVDLGDIKRFASVLRVLLGTCIGHLCRGTPDPSAEVVTFFLDEMPRLKRMDVVEEALDLGRGFGVRLWMFAQNVGQLETNYPNAHGMLGNCLAQCYMNPDAERSKWLQSHLGNRRGLLDGTEKPLVEASELTGTAFADRIIVMLNGMDNAAVRKHPFYADPEAVKRVAAPDWETETAETS